MINSRSILAKTSLFLIVVNFKTVYCIKMGPELYFSCHSSYLASILIKLFPSILVYIVILELRLLSVSESV